MPAQPMPPTAHPLTPCSSVSCQPGCHAVPQFILSHTSPLPEGNVTKPVLSNAGTREHQAPTLPALGTCFSFGRIKVGYTPKQGQRVGSYMFPNK